MSEQCNRVARLVVGGSYVALSTDFLGTFELAQWCKLLRDRGRTGQQVAGSLGRSEGYVNNLIRILERASLDVLARWKLEQHPESTLVHVCATDWLMHVCVLPADVQNVELQKRIERLSRVPAPDEAPTSESG